MASDAGALDAVDAVDAADCARGLLCLRARGSRGLDGLFWSLFGFPDFEGQKSRSRVIFSKKKKKCG
jgi:hypothetical protein